MKGTNQLGFCLYGKHAFLRVLGMSLLFSCCALYAGDLAYQDRGDRHEGIDERQSAEPDIALYSAVRDAPRAPAKCPPDIHLGFYLEGTSNAYITVRENSLLHGYYLDKVQRQWVIGANHYAWPTAEVIQKKGLKIGELAVVVRLYRPTASVREVVAPVTITGRPVEPRDGGTYRFRLRTAHGGTLRFRILSVAGIRLPCQSGTVVEDLGMRGVTGAAYTSRSWQADDVPEGWYCLETTAKMEYRNRIIGATHETFFYHVSRSITDAGTESKSRRPLQEIR